MQRRLWLLWVSGTAIGLGIGGGLAEVVSSAVAVESGLRNLLFSWHWQISVGFCFGAPVLLAQYLVLRAFVPGAGWWLAMTMLGLAIGAAAGAFVGLMAASIWTFSLGRCVWLEGRTSAPRVYLSRCSRLPAVRLAQLPGSQWEHC